MKKTIYTFNLLLLIVNISALARVLPQDVIWNDDETGYYVVKNNSIVLVSTKGKEDKIILSSADVSDMKIESFGFSKNMSKALIFTNSKRVWRYNTRGDYWVYDLESRNGKRLGSDLPEASLMFAKFSPDSKKVAYVSKEIIPNSFRNSSTRANIYIEDVQNNQITKLTESDEKGKIINGTFDWVYEEEFSCRDGFLFNDNSNKIAFWEIDANGVKDFLMINNTDSIYPFNIPVEYPKVGEDLTPARIGVIDLSSMEVTWMKIPGESNRFYLPRMTWVPGEEKLMIQQLNRKQNHSKYYIANANNGAAELIMEDKDDAWIDVRNTWPYQDKAGWKFINDGKEFLYTTEKDGWSHVYKYNIDTKKEVLITKGEYDVVRPLSYDEKNKEIYFIASPKNPTERYLYKTSENKKPQLLTPKALVGTHNYQISTKSLYAFHSFSNYYTEPMDGIVTLPDHKYIKKEDDMLEKFDPSKKDDNPLEFFQIKTVDGVEMEGWLVKPDNMDPNKKYPVLFYFYSEPAGQTGVNRFGVGRTALYDGRLGEDGYVYVTFDGRGTPSPKGREWRKRKAEKS